MWRLSRRRYCVATLVVQRWDYGAVVLPSAEGETPRHGRKTPASYNEVNILVLGDWQRLAQELPPDTPVLFRYDGTKPMESEDYCDGLRAYPARMWEGHSGWQPCVLVELGECF